MDSPIPVNSILLAGNEKQYLNECIDTGWISGEGPFIQRFEAAFSSYVGRQHGICIANGSAALDIAVLAAGILPGDEVIMPAFTIISPAFSIVRAGATPVLVDCQPDTFNMCPEQVKKRITDKTKAIIIVHIYGLPVDVDAIITIAREHDLKIIEDAAEMHGQEYNGKKCGSFGDISTFSFYANKLVTSGEGGMIVCDDPEIDRTCRRLKNLAFHPDLPRFVHQEMGYNYRMTNMQAALGLAQFEQVEKFLERKKEIGAFYNEGLNFLENYGFQLPVAQTGTSSNVYWVYSLVAPSQEEKERLVEYLSKHKIGTRPFFWSMHEQPVFIKMGLFKGESYPVSELIARRGFYLPSGLGLTNEELRTVVDLIRNFYKV